jgi:peptidoglycan/LPS O-acetylase OafA/YrhL
VLLAALACLMVVGETVTVYFRIWLFGALVAALPRAPVLTRHVRWWMVSSLTACAALVAATHVGFVKAWFGDSLLFIDTVNAAAFSVCLYIFLHDRQPAGPTAYRRMAAFLAGCSFTLYATHLPLLVFLRAWLEPGRSWSPTPTTIGLSLVIAAGAFLYAVILAHLFEARTDAVRRWVMTVVAGRPMAPVGDRVAVAERREGSA